MIVSGVYLILLLSFFQRFYTKKSSLNLKNTQDLAFRSKGAKDPIKTAVKNDQATSLPPKTPPSGFYKKK